MIRRRVLLLAAGVGLLGASPAAAQTLPVVDSLFASWARSDGPGCIVGVRREGTTLHLKAYGMANLEYGVPLTPESISETGSVAKQFTAAALVLLAHQGRLSLDDDIRKYLPEVPDFGATITIRHLLTHTSGLRDQWALLSLTGWPPGTAVHSVEQILDLVHHQERLNFVPGAWYLYSNTGFTLAGAIVSRVTGTPFAQWTRENLFQPLGMRDTQWRDDFTRVVPRRATAYGRARAGWVQDMPFTRVIGNGGLLTTVPDLLIWNDALDSGKIPGGPALVEALQTAGTLNDGDRIAYGLGIGVNTWRGLREFSHGGATAGYRTQLSRWPDRGLSIAILCNAAPANPARDAHLIAERVLQVPADEAPPSRPVAIAPERVAGFAGVYRDTVTDRTLTLSVKDGVLQVSGGGAAAALVHLGRDRFWSAVAGNYRMEPAGGAWRIVQQDNGTHVYLRQAPVDTAAMSLAEFVGRYRSSELETTLDISQAGGRLTVRRAWDPALPLLPAYPDGFAVQGRTIRFSRDAAGRVDGLRIFAGRAIDVRFTRLTETGVSR